MSGSAWQHLPLNFSFVFLLPNQVATSCHGHNGEGDAALGSDLLHIIRYFNVI
jgi:hypothetical protein